MQLNEQQVGALALRALRWIQTIERLNDFSRLNRGGRSGRTSQILDDVHLLMLSLEHLSSCVSHLIGNTASTRLDKLAREFIGAWGDVSTVRDMLEHEEEYISGSGRFPDRVHPQWAEIGYPWGQFIWYGDGIVTVAVVGGNYHVVVPIRAALELKTEVSEVAGADIA